MLEQQRSIYANGMFRISSLFRQKGSVSMHDASYISRLQTTTKRRILQRSLVERNRIDGGPSWDSLKAQAAASLIF